MLPSKIKTVYQIFVNYYIHINCTYHHYCDLWSVTSLWTVWMTDCSFFTIHIASVFKSRRGTWEQLHDCIVENNHHETREVPIDGEIESSHLFCFEFLSNFFGRNTRSAFFSHCIHETGSPELSSHSSISNKATKKLLTKEVYSIVIIATTNPRNIPPWSFILLELLASWSINFAMPAWPEPLCHLLLGRTFPNNMFRSHPWHATMFMCHYTHILLLLLNYHSLRSTDHREPMKVTERSEIYKTL